MEDEQRSGRPKSARTEENLDAVKLTEEDKRRTCEEVQEITGISHVASWWKKLTRRKFSRNGFHTCSPRNKGKRGSVDAVPISAVIAKELTFSTASSVADGIELKSQSAQWRNSGSPRLEKARLKFPKCTSRLGEMPSATRKAILAGICGVLDP